LNQGKTASKNPGGSLKRVFHFEERMIVEVLMILPLYAIIFWIFFRCRHIIKAMTELNEMFSDMMVDAEVNKREFLLEKIEKGEKISNAKTLWTAERLEKASEKVVNKLYENYQNPSPTIACGSAKSKVNKQEALEMGKPVCPIVIEMYAEGLKAIVDQLPYISGKYTINVEKLKANISANRVFFDNLAIKVGSKMIEQMGENSAAHVGVSLAAMTWNAVEKIEDSENKSDEATI